MVMDKGLSLRQAEDLIGASGHLVDIVKLGLRHLLRYART